MSNEIKKFYVKPLYFLLHLIFWMFVLMLVFILFDVLVEYILGNKETSAHFFYTLQSDKYLIAFILSVVFGYPFFLISSSISIENEHITGMTTSLFRRKYLLKDLILHKENRYYLILKRKNSDWPMLHIPKFIENYDDCYKILSRHINLDKGH